MDTVFHIKRHPPVKPRVLIPDLSKYMGKWVALTGYTTDSKVICSGKTSKGVYDRARRQGYESPAVLLVTPNLGLPIII